MDTDELFGVDHLVLHAIDIPTGSPHEGLLTSRGALSKAFVRVASNSEMSGGVIFGRFVICSADLFDKPGERVSVLQKGHSFPKTGIVLSVDMESHLSSVLLEGEVDSRLQPPFGKASRLRFGEKVLICHHSRDDWSVDVCVAMKGFSLSDETDGNVFITPYSPKNLAGSPIFSSDGYLLGILIGGVKNSSRLIAVEESAVAEIVLRTCTLVA